MTMHFVLYAIIQIELDRYMLSLMVPDPNVMRSHTCIVYDMLLMHQDCLDIHPSPLQFLKVPHFSPRSSSITSLHNFGPKGVAVPVCPPLCAAS